MLVFLAVAFSAIGLLILQALFHETLSLDFLGSSTVRDIIFASAIVNVGVIIGLFTYLLWYPPVRRLALYSFYSLIGLFMLGVTSLLLPRLGGFEIKLTDGVNASTSFLHDFSSPIGCMLCAIGAWISFNQYKIETEKQNAAK